MKLFLTSLAILVFQSTSKVLFNKDLTINGTLSATSATFDRLNITSFCNVDELLSAEHIKVNLVDAKEIYVDVIRG